jgi:hypothetical protein
MDITRKLSCLFIFIYNIIVILSEAERSGAQSKDLQFQRSTKSYTSAFPTNQSLVPIQAISWLEWERES